CRPSRWLSSLRSCSGSSDSRRNGRGLSIIRGMTTETNTALAAALEHLRQNHDRHLGELDEFLRIESVSADPTKAGEVRHAAQWIMLELATIGFEHVALHETSGHPIVTADWLHAGPHRPTVLVYCHYDVQPPDPLAEWVRPPFDPRHEEGRVYARGVGDDKGQIFIHLKAAEEIGRASCRERVKIEEVDVA